MDNNLSIFARGRQGLFKWFFIILLGVFAVLSAFYGYFYYVDQMEKDLAKKLQVFMDKREKPLSQWKKSQKKKVKNAAKKELSSLSLDFKNLYLSMPNRNNAIFAGLQHVFLEWDLGNAKGAEEFLMEMRKKSPKSPFSPTILYQLALLSADRGALEQTKVFIEQFVKKHSDDFLLGEMLFIKARILFQEKRFVESYDVYQSIVKNKDLSLYSRLADIELSYFAAMGLGFSDAAANQKMLKEKMSDATKNPAGDDKNPADDDKKSAGKKAAKKETKSSKK